MTLHPAVDVDVDVDVVIVGAGPIGLVSAILLGQHGRSVTVLEQWPSPYPLPRAVHFDHEVGRILQSCGVGEEVRTLSQPAEVYEWRNGRGDTLLRFGRIGVAKSGWPFSSMFCQPALEAVLRARVESLPTVDVRTGVRVRRIDQHDDHVAVGYSPLIAGPNLELLPGPGEPEALRTRYVVGCDGANSTVRELIGIDNTDRGFHHDWLIVDVILDEQRVFDPVNVQICDPRRPTTAVSGGPGRRRWEFMRLPEENLEDLRTETRAWELLGPWDVHPGNARLERHAVYTFHGRVAERWQDGRVLLAGDAAHLMPPFAGQGMCSGVRDAANLAWKLDLILDGLADTTLLATYDEERRPSAEAAVDFSIELGKIICVADHAEAATRDDAMSAMYDGTVSEAPELPGIPTGVIQANAPLAGRLFPQARIDGQLFDDVHGAGWRLVTVDPDAGDLDPSLVQWFSAIKGSVVEVAGRSDDLEDWFGAHDVRWALQRPDFHIFGTATDARAAQHLLTDLRAQMTNAATHLEKTS